MSNAQGNRCVERLEQWGMQPVHWKFLEATQTGCRGCYCGSVESQRQQRQLAAENRKLVAEQKRKVKEHEMVDGKCMMISRNSSSTCHAAKCFEDGVRCMATPDGRTPDGRCHLHDRANERMIHWTDETLPATCKPCRCIKAGGKLAQDPRALEPERMEQRRLEVAQKLSLKRKIQEHEMADGNCTMTSRKSSDICQGSRCFEDGLRCLPIANGRCYLHSREHGRKISRWERDLLPASCQPCKCTNVPKKKAQELEISAAIALKKMKAG
jgi:hypothetical protein